MSDIRESLDQLDRRLDELRRQIAALAEDPRPAAPLGPPPAHRLRSVPIPPPELIHPHVPPEPDASQEAVPEASQEASPGPPPVLAEPQEPQGGAEGPAAQVDREIPKGLDVLFGRASTPPPPTPHRPPDQVTTEIHELVAVRDQLLAGARELVRAYERQLDALEHMAASGLPPAVPASPPKAGEQVRPVFFEGTVALAVSGAHRIQTIEVLQDALSRARHVDQVYIRRCHRGKVWLELTLSAGAELLGEFNRVLPFPFAVTSATGQEIAVALEGER